MMPLFRPPIREPIVLSTTACPRWAVVELLLIAIEPARFCWSTCLPAAVLFNPLKPLIKFAESILAAVYAWAPQPPAAAAADTINTRQSAL